MEEHVYKECNMSVHIKCNFKFKSGVSILHHFTTTRIKCSIVGSELLEH